MKDRQRETRVRIDCVLDPVYNGPEPNENEDDNIQTQAEGHSVLVRST